jgi:hypothetical protein
MIRNTSMTVRRCRKETRKGPPDREEAQWRQELSRYETATFTDVVEQL